MVNKFDLNVRALIVEKYAEGYTKSQIAKLLGIHRATLYRWIDKHNISKDMEECRTDYMSGKVSKGFVRLAEGAQETQEVNETYEKISDTEYHKKISKVRILPPNEKALQILSRRYAPEFSDTAALQDNSNKQITFNFDTRVMNLRELKELNAMSNPLGDISADILAESVDNSDATQGSDIIEVDSEAADSPPTSGADDE